MKRQFFLPALVFFVLILSACGGSAGSTGGSGSGTGGAQQGLSGATSFIDCPGNTNTSAAAPETGTITLNVAGATSSPAEDALVQQNLKKFTQTHPNIKVNWTGLADYPTKMRANISSGNVPDVFYVQPQMGSEYINAGKLLNLSPYMAKTGVKTSDYYEALMSPFTCKGGQVYGIPKDWNTLGLFYNKQMFQSAGVALPTDNWTWTDMQNAAKKLTKSGNAATSTYGITLAADASRWGAFLFAAGGSMLNKDGTQATFNTTAGIKSLQFYTGFQKDGTSVLPGSVSSAWPGEAFGKQRAAMALEGGWLIPFLSSTYPNVQYDIAPLPKDPDTGKRANLIYTNAWGAYASTKHPEAAWELIKYMTGTDVQKTQLDAGFALPTIKGLQNDPYFTQHPGFKVMFNASSYGYADYYGAHDDVIHTDLQQSIESVMLGKSDAPTALKNAASKINNELQS